MFTCTYQVEAIAFNHWQFQIPGQCRFNHRHLGASVVKAEYYSAQHAQLLHEIYSKPRGFCDYLIIHGTVVVLYGPASGSVH